MFYDHSIKFHMRDSSVSFVIAIKPKDKCRFCIDTLLFVLYSTERLSEYILHIFEDVFTHTI
jgi:hypothetical protein